MHDDWHVDRVVSAIRSAAEVSGNPVVADALAAAIARHHGRERVAARKRKQEEEEEDAAHRREEEAIVSGLQIELRAFQGTDPSMSLLTAVEFITHDPAHRVALYGRCCAEDRSVNGMGQYDPRLLKIAASSAMDLALLERRAQAEGFQV